MNKKPLALIILDGFGEAAACDTNAVTVQGTPCISALKKRWPNALLKCSGMSVGLPEGQMGNSEVGHTNLGAGRVVYQELTRITKSIEDGDFFENPVLTAACDNCLEKDSVLHLMGLVSDGGVHSHMKHIFGLLELAKRKGLEKVAVHCFLDGRDVPPTSGAGYIRQLEEEMKKIGVGRIATVGGRYYGMDRERHWDRIKLSYDAQVNAQGPGAPDAAEAVEKSYLEGVTDEFMIPTVIGGGCPIGSDDSVVFFNFRPDRARQTTRSLVDPDFDGWNRGEAVKPFYVCMAQYDAAMPNVQVAFPPQSMKNTFGEYISQKGLTQLRIAEYTKYAHVTFFFNAGVEQPCEGEDRVLIDSPEVATYDLQPEMSAFKVTEECVKRIESGKYDVIILNFANCDMVGHTGVMDAAVKAVEAVDSCTDAVVKAVLAAGGKAIITADHGNAEIMLENGQPLTAHTTSPVPVILCAEGFGIRDGALCDIAPTMLELLGLPQPAEMTGRSLLVK